MGATATGRHVRTDEGEDLLVLERTFPTTPAVVWAAITDPDRLARWIGTWSGDPATGSVRFRMTAEGDDVGEETYEIRSCVPMRRLEVHAADDYGVWDLSFTLAEAAGGTTLTFAQVVHDPPALESVGPGWDYYLDRLVAAETGGDVSAVDFDADYASALAPHYAALAAEVQAREVGAAAEAPRALIGSTELRALLDVDPPLLLDVRWALSGSDPDGYRAGHLPGAVFCDLDAELAAPPGDGGRHPLPTADQLATAMERLGIATGRPVVVYDGGPGAAAARAWWCLRWAGHEDVRVLDGGLAAWVATGGAVEQGEVAPTPADIVVVRPGSLPTVDVDQVLAGEVGTLLDARSAERFRGEVEPVDPVAGHIPGATSCPTTALQRPDGRYLAPAELREVLVGGPAPRDGDDGVVGDDDGGPALTAYCGSGITASQLVLAGHEAGLSVALYPGSWSHWVRDPARPVATGAEPT